METLLAGLDVIENAVNRGYGANARAMRPRS
jgi:hypothetical protein